MNLSDVFWMVSLGFVMALGLYIPVSITSHVVRSLNA